MQHASSVYQRSATNPGSVLICALPPNAAGREQPGGFIACILQQQSNNTMRRNVVESNIAHGGSVVGVSPEILQGRIVSSFHESMWQPIITYSD